MTEEQRIRQISRGKCYYCDGYYSKRSISKHINSCRQNHKINSIKGEQKEQKSKFFHFIVEGRYSPQYWMHIEANLNAKLKDLDNFLRDVWLDCCGHLSAFRINGINYYSELYQREDNDMDLVLGDIFSPGLKFSYEYDFGSTTELSLKVLSVFKSHNGKPMIKIITRNDPPIMYCDYCENIAKHVCTICLCEGMGRLCKECAKIHKCGDEMFLPVVNSPRVGVCGYCG